MLCFLYVTQLLMQMRLNQTLLKAAYTTV